MWKNCIADQIRFSSFLKLWRKAKLTSCGQRKSQGLFFINKDIWKGLFLGSWRARSSQTREMGMILCIGVCAIISLSDFSLGQNFAIPGAPFKCSASCCFQCSEVEAVDGKKVLEYPISHMGLPESFSGLRPACFFSMPSYLLVFFLDVLLRVCRHLSPLLKMSNYTLFSCCQCVKQVWL